MLAQQLPGVRVHQADMVGIPLHRDALAEGLRPGFGSSFVDVSQADSPPESVVTSSASLAGFAGKRRPRGGRSSTRAPFK
jgi:hypothetical protein